MRVIILIMKTKLYRKLIEKMNACTVFLLILTSSLFLISLKAESNFLDLSYNWIHDPFKNFFQSNEIVDIDLIDKTQEEHVVIFDAGSTGTRIHVFTFLIQTSKKNLFAGNRKQKITLKNEYFKSISPGLSYYAEQPDQATKSIESLLQFANKFVDEDFRKDTYLSLIATAGLRLLPNEQSSAILRNIENLFKNLDKPFKLSDDSIRILDGNSEGIFSWVTINFLLKKIHNAKKSVAVLDLGGGSTQITFSPNLEETFRQSPEHFLIKRKILGEEEYLYTHSYLGFGLMATRKEILLESINRNKQYFVHENVNLTHPCFPNGQVYTWSYQYVTYTITGVEGDCYQFINHYFKRTNKVKRAPELNLRNIYGISYYYDLMVNVGKVDPSKHIGQVSVYDYYLAAKKICGSYFDSEEKTSNRRFRGQKRLEKESIYEIKNPNEFQCLDLTYTANLLNTGFGLQWRKKLTLGKKINNVELSWGLGAAFSKLKFA